jgi:hypothetical protein
MTDVLNENQRRHFSVLLTMLAQSTARVEALAAESPPVESALVESVDDLPVGFGRRIEPHVRSLRAAITSLASQLEIQPKRQSRRNSIRALLVTEIVRLEDSMARGLRGYGNVDPRVQELVDPKLKVLIQELQAIRGVLEDRKARVEE